ncbi:hypothetical protein F5J12DRAFT_788653 [Pisolithus orientalis]|uniref:uncharacterized protein n=1 Tax=Pisolithus orientalis TaxID=936130 RepID=UPI002224D8E9|nr:uncharacterized protein F5J12DRAFT_788653 [Pisolithus orientalis]KAI5981389.1 hypothetical protein F5J12DRAFT_788653 [Pisolithus orientalis]
MSTEAHHTAITILENIIVLEVDNILQGWPVYVINFTPEDTCPHKIILHLKNPSKYEHVTVDSDDDDSKSGACAREYIFLIKAGTLTTNSDAQVMVYMEHPDGPTVQYKHEESSNDGDDSNKDEASSGEDTKPLSSNNANLPPGKDTNLSFGKDTQPTKAVHAIPVALAGLPKDIIPTKCKRFMTWPEAVKAVEDTGCSSEHSDGVAQ